MILDFLRESHPFQAILNTDWQANFKPLFRRQITNILSCQDPVIFKSIYERLEIFHAYISVLYNLLEDLID